MWRTVCLPAPARGVQDDQVAFRDAGLREDLLDLPLLDPDPREVRQVVAGVLHRALRRLDAEHRTGLAEAFREGAREDADAAVQVEGHLALARHQALHDGLDQGVRGLRVDLPEAAHAHAVRTAVRALPYEGAAVDAVDPAVLLLHAQDGDRLVQLDQGQAAAGAGVRTTWRSWEPVAAIASTVAICGQSCFSMPSSLTPGAAIMQCSIASISCERWRRRPTVPSSSMANCTRVRHWGTCPAGSLSPSAGMTVPSQPASSGVSPASRFSCSATTSPLSRRWAPGLACCQSQPPHLPGPAYGQGPPRGPWRRRAR